METRKGLHGFGLREADRGSQDSPTLSRQRERLPPALGKTNRFESREEKGLAHYPEAPYRWVEPTVSAIIKTNQIYRFFRLSDKNT